MRRRSRSPTPARRAPGRALRSRQGKPRGDRLAASRAKTGATVVPPYDHPWILTGQGTVGPGDRRAGQGGSASRSTPWPRPAPAAGCHRHRARREGAQPHHRRPCRRAGGLRRSRPLARGRNQAEANDRLSGSICDALLAPTPGDVTFPLAQKLLAPGLVVDDEEVLDAMEAGVPRVQDRGRAGRRGRAGGGADRQAAGEGTRRSPSSARAATSTTRPSSGPWSGIAGHDAVQPPAPRMADHPLGQPRQRASSALISAIVVGAGGGTLAAGVGVVGIAISLLIATPISPVRAQGPAHWPFLRRLRRLPLPPTSPSGSRSIVVIIVGCAGADRLLMQPSSDRSPSTRCSAALWCSPWRCRCWQPRVRDGRPAGLRHAQEPPDRPLRAAQARAEGVPADRHEGLDGPRRAPGADPLPRAAERVLRQRRRCCARNAARRSTNTSATRPS